MFNDFEFGDGNEDKESARHVMLHIIHQINLALASSQLTEKEKESLETHRDDLFSAFQGIEEVSEVWFRGLPDDVFLYLARAMEASFKAGARTQITSQAFRHARRLQSDVARTAKKLRQDAKDQRLINAISKVCRTLALEDSEKFADSIRENVCKELGISSGSYPSTRVIRRKIRANSVGLDS